jgi:hypothetical protein
MAFTRCYITRQRRQNLAVDDGIPGLLSQHEIAFTT